MRFKSSTSARVDVEVAASGTGMNVPTLTPTFLLVPNLSRRAGAVEVPGTLALARVLVVLLDGRAVFSPHLTLALTFPVFLHFHHFDLLVLAEAMTSGRGSDCHRREGLGLGPDGDTLQLRGVAAAAALLDVHTLGLQHGVVGIRVGKWHRCLLGFALDPFVLH